MANSASAGADRRVTVGRGLVFGRAESRVRRNDDRAIDCRPEASGRREVKAMFKNNVLNWKTSLWGGLLGTLPGTVMFLCGLAGLLHVNVPGVTITGNPADMVLNGFALIVAGGVGWLAKDGDVTGGTRLAPSGYVKFG